MKAKIIIDLANKVLAGGSITFDEALELSRVDASRLPYLLAAANEIRDTFAGSQVDLCSIVNGRSGLCPENCFFCAQSAHHKAKIPIYSLLCEEKLVEAAKTAEANGALRFSIVTSGGGMDSLDDFLLIIRTYERIKSETNLKLCASLGSLSLEQARKLKDAGVERYHHNLEASISFYPVICSTHTYHDRVRTINTVREAGLDVCSGGIMGMGETMEQRLEMAFELKALNIRSIPLNVLTPIRGTPLENQRPLPPLEILKTFALYRFVHPQGDIRTAGGREVNLRDLQGTALISGINGMLIGGYLTTGGRQCHSDLQMIQDAGLYPLSAQ